MSTGSRIRVPPRSSAQTRRFALGALLVALLLAGVVSYWASSAPDGMNKVAADTGFGERGEAHPLDDSPFAGYGTTGLGDGFASGAVAGVAGVAVTLALAGGLSLMLRRKGSGASAGSTPSGVTPSGHRTDDPATG